MIIMQIIKINVDNKEYQIEWALSEYFDELKNIYDFKKSPKYDYLYELDDETEVAVLDFSEDDIKYVDGYPVQSLESQLA